MLNAATEADDHLLFLQEVVKKYFMIGIKELSALLKKEKMKQLSKRKPIQTNMLIRL